MTGAPNDVRRGRWRGRGPAALLALALLGAAATIPAAPVGTGAADAVAASVGQATTAPTRYLDPVFDAVQRTSDVAYREALDVDGELRTLHLEIYEPAGDTAAQRPVVLLFHGGFFVFGDHLGDSWGAGPRYAESWARRGYVAVSVQYRLRPDMGLFPDVDLAELEAANLDAHDDAVAAIDWLVARADELRLDPRAIVAYGPSAGGAIAWNLAWMQGSGLRPDPSGVAAAVSVAGAPFETTAGTGEPLAAASPGDAPVLAFHGTDDGIVPIELAAAPCRAAADAGVRCELVPYEGLGHPGLDPRFLDLIGDAEQRTAAFLAEVVLAPLGYLVWPPPVAPPVTVPVTEPVTVQPTVPPAAPAGGPVRATAAVPLAGRPSYTG